MPSAAVLRRHQLSEPERRPAAAARPRRPARTTGADRAGRLRRPAVGPAPPARAGSGCRRCPPPHAGRRWPAVDVDGRGLQLAAPGRDEVPLGVIDDPANQRQGVCRLDLTRAGGHAGDHRRPAVRQDDRAADAGRLARAHPHAARGRDLRARPRRRRHAGAGRAAARRRRRAAHRPRADPADGRGDPRDDRPARAGVPQPRDRHAWKRCATTTRPGGSRSCRRRTSYWSSTTSARSGRLRRAGRADHRHPAARQQLRRARGDVDDALERRPDAEPGDVRHDARAPAERRVGLQHRPAPAGGPAQGRSGPDAGAGRQAVRPVRAAAGGRCRLRREADRHPGGPGGDRAVDLAGSAGSADPDPAAAVAPRPGGRRGPGAGRRPDRCGRARAGAGVPRPGRPGQQPGGLRRQRLGQDEHRPARRTAADRAAHRPTSSCSR